MDEFRRRMPRYPDDSDYKTNAPSYYEALARNNKLLEILSKRIYDYDKTLDSSLENIKNVLDRMEHKIGEGFNDEIQTLLIKWVDDGTLDHIINVTLMNKKADLVYVDDKLNSVNQQLAQTTDSLNDHGENVLYSGATGDGVTDDSIFIQNIVDNSADGDNVFVPNRKYYFKRPIYINKSIAFESVSTSENGCEFIFDGCNGLIFGAEEIRLKNIVIRGINRQQFNNIEQAKINDFGTVGLNLTRNSENSLRRVVMENVQVWGFNVGNGMFIGEGSVWSGAYHEFKNVVLAYNDIGVYADGMTHGKFFGGTITNNRLHGIYGEASQSYTNMDFIGTSIENNGERVPANYKNYGIYAGDKVKIRLTNSYVENQTQFADDGGSIYYLSTHIHATTEHFSRGSGDINSMFSFGDFINVHKFGVGFEEVSNSFTPTNVEIIRTNFDYYGNAIRVESNAGIGKPKEIRSKWQNLSARTLKVKDLEWVKISFRIKIQSGFNITGFNFNQRLTITTPTSSDGKNNTITFPAEIYSDFMEEKVSFYYKPRKGDGYLNSEEYISTIAFDFLFGDGDHTLSKMSVDIIDPKIELHTKTDTTIYSNNKIIKPPPTETNVTLSNGWTNKSGFNLVAKKNIDGLVTISGVVEGGTVDNGTVFGTLSSGYYPTKNIRIPVSDGFETFIVEIRSNGTMRITATHLEDSSSKVIHINTSFYV